jgi:hypothetical protein
MTITEIPNTILCPDWCRHAEQGGHDPWWDDESGRMRVDHPGPDFGPYLWSNGEQIDGTLTAEVEMYDTRDHNEIGVPMSPDQLRQLAADALAAAEWLEAQR